MWLIILSTLLIAIGIAGCILPYPGNAIILIGLYVASFIPNSEGILTNYPLWYWLIQITFCLLSFLVDYILPYLGAKRFKSSKAGLWGCFVGSIIGVFFAPIGLFLGPFFGAFLGEILIAQRHWQQSSLSGVGAVLGFILSIFAKLIIAALMLLLYFCI